MARTRIISQSKALYVSPTGLLSTAYGGVAGASGLVPTQLGRIDKFSFDVDFAGARQDVREFGRLARLAVVRSSELSPKVSFGYYLTDGANEHNLGLNIRGTAGISGAVSQFISGILTENPLKNEKNLYMLTVQEGVDAFDGVTFSGSRASHDVIAFGNAALSSYAANFSVGEIPRADVEMECSNLKFYVGSSSGLLNPAINKSTAVEIDTGKFVLEAPSTGVGAVDVLQHGDVTVQFSSDSFGFGGANFNTIHAQSVAFDVPLSRAALEKIGNAMPYAKPLDFPINVTCSINANVSEFKSGSLQTVLTGCTINAGTDIVVQVRDRCKLATGNRLVYVLKNAVLDSQGFSMGLDDQEAVDLTFSAQIGGATSTDAGLFVSGSFGADNSGIGVTGRDNEKPRFLPL